MKRLRDILEVALLASFIVLILLLCYFTIHGARKVKALGDEASSTLTDLNRTIAIAAGAFSNLEKGGRAWKDNSDAQAKQSTAALENANLALRNLNVAAKSLDSLIASTNTSLNSSLLPNLSRAINDQNAALLETEKQVGAVATSAVTTLADTDKIVASPEIKDSLDNLAAATRNGSQATAEAAETMKDVRKAADYELKELMKPVTKVKAVSLFVARIVGRFLGF